MGFYKWLALLLFVLIVGCTGRTHEPVEQAYATHNPTPMEVLKEQADSDIFMLNGIVYRNAEDLDWVQNMALKPGDQAGEITTQHKADMDFKEGMSTKLPVGTKLYRTNPRNQIILAQVNNKYVPYVGLVEG